MGGHGKTKTRCWKGCAAATCTTPTRSRSGWRYLLLSGCSFFSRTVHEESPGTGSLKRQIHYNNPALLLLAAAVCLCLFPGSSAMSICENNICICVGSSSSSIVYLYWKKPMLPHHYVLWSFFAILLTVLKAQVRNNKMMWEAWPSLWCNNRPTLCWLCMNRWKRHEWIAVSQTQNVVSE